MAQRHIRFYPNILDSGDLAIMDTAIRSVLFACTTQEGELDADRIARIVLRLYRMGLTDPEKLSALATRLAREACVTGSGADRFARRAALPLPSRK